MAIFDWFFAFFLEFCGSLATLATLFYAKNYGQNLGQMSKNDPSTLSEAKWEISVWENCYLGRKFKLWLLILAQICLGYLNTLLAIKRVAYSPKSHQNVTIESPKSHQRVTKGTSKWQLEVIALQGHKHWRSGVIALYFLLYNIKSHNLLEGFIPSFPITCFHWTYYWLTVKSFDQILPICSCAFCTCK